MRVVWIPVIVLLVASACGLTGGKNGECVPTHHGVETCDGIDNNCDGRVDEMATCPEGSVCRAGSCACEKETCGNPPACVDTSTDVQNCGACAHACKPGESCVSGSCACLFKNGPVCGGQCIDLDTDPENCGACRHKCTVTGSVCSAGACVCPKGLIQCGLACVDPLTNRANCGHCGGTCDVACSGAQCVGVVQVAVGGSHSCARLEGGEVRCWGEDDSFEVGDGQTGDVGGPQLTGVLFASDVAAGSHHTCAVVGGKIVCWGSNGLGQIGDGTTTTAKKATEVVGIDNATAIALGDTHSCARRSNGTVACWGGNSFGELGDGTMTDRHVPTAVKSIGIVQAIAVGAHHSCALLENGSVACWGSNQFGELGTGASSSTPAIVGGLPPIKTLRAGGAHTCAIDGTMKVYCWGKNDDHELTSGGSIVSNPIALADPGDDVALGSGHMCRGLYQRLFCSGNLIAGASPTSLQPVLGTSAGDLHNCAKVPDPNAFNLWTVGCWGANMRGQCAGMTAFVDPIGPVEF
jgi:hypothetical protein